MSNLCRQQVPAEEKLRYCESLDKYTSQRAKLGKIGQKIAEETGMSYRWGHEVSAE